MIELIELIKLIELIELMRQSSAFWTIGISRTSTFDKLTYCVIDVSVPPLSHRDPRAVTAPSLPREGAGHRWIPHPSTILITKHKL